MLKHLSIKNYILVEEIEIDFDEGLSIIYGETGAGKSILVSALSLLCGSRTSFDTVMDETKRTMIEGTFILSDDYILSHPNLKEYIDGNELIVTRTLSPSKNSQARINGLVVTLKELIEVMKDIIVISSQGSTSIFTSSSYQLEMLDKQLYKNNFGSFIEDYKQKYKVYKENIKKRAEYEEEINASDIEYLTYEIEKLSKYDVKKDEFETLSNDIEELQSIYDNSKAYQIFDEVTSGEEYIESMNKIYRALSSLNTEESNNLLNIMSELTSGINHLASFASYNEEDLSRLDQLNERLFELQPLMKKYSTTAEYFARLEELQEKLDRKQDSINVLAKMDKEIEESYKLCLEAGRALSERRKSAADELTKLVCNELSSLALREDGFKIDISQENISERGLDRVEMKVCLNKGQDFSLLKDTASFGETSRLLIALISSLNVLSPVDTLILDEVDTGISGKIAVTIAKKMLKISKNSSIVAISHLGPVIAAGDNFYHVYKSDDGDRTNTHLHKVILEEAINDLSIIISGKDKDEESISVAKKLMEEVRS